MVQSNTSFVESAEPPAPPGLEKDRRSFAAGVVSLALGSGVAQGLTAAGTLVLTRACTPADFGIFALFLTVATLFQPVVNGRYDAAIMLPESDQDAANVLGLSLAISLLVSAASGIAAVLVGHPLVRLTGEPSLSVWLWAIPLSLVMWGFTQALSCWSARMRRFHVISASKAATAALTIGLQLALLKTGSPGPRALILGWLIGQAAGPVLLLADLTGRQLRFITASLNYSSVLRQVRRYRNFPIFTTWYSFIGSGSKQLTLVILRSLADLRTVGLFSLASKIVYLPVSLIAGSMSQVFFEKAATELKKGNLEPFVARILRLQCIFGAPLLVIFLFQADLVAPLLGARWTGVANYARAMVCIGFLEFLTNWMDRLFDVRQRQHLALIWVTARGIGTLAALYAALASGRGPVFAVFVYVATDCFFSLLWMAGAFRVAGFRLRALTTVATSLICVGLTTSAFMLGLRFLLGANHDLAVTCCALAVTGLAMAAILLRQSKLASSILS